MVRVFKKERCGRCARYRRAGRRAGVCSAFALAIACWAGSARAGDALEPASDELGNMNLEDLMNLEINSVSKQKQRIGDSPAAIYAITQEDIRRSGMTSIPELLRMVPGLEVGRISADQWAIGSRGFNDLYQNKLLVLMDGRTMYQPLSGGVYWDSVDYMLEDLERIEAIRGPGATLWGSNAVNGVINITTKSARDTQGFLLTSTVSNAEEVGGVRYGGKLDDRTFYRVYTKYRTAEDFPLDSGDGHDGWDSLRGGFRIDRYATDADTLTLQGDFYSSRVGQTDTRPLLAPPFSTKVTHTTEVAGGYLLGKWAHVVSATSDFSLQFYYDRNQRHDDDGGLDYDQDTWDIDFQHRFAPADGHQIIWGAGFRYLPDSLEGPDSIFVISPEHRHHTVASAFAQDDIALVPNRFHVVIGSKFEQNSQTGFEVQPSLRAIWTPNETQTVWGAVSRAVRTPSRFNDDANLVVATFPTGPSSPTDAVELAGNHRVHSEDLLAFELGYRVRPARTVTVDVAAFYNSYNGLIGSAPGAPSLQAGPPPALVFPLNWANDIEGRNYGVEIASTWNVAENWRLAASYSWLASSFSGGTADSRAVFKETTPVQQAQIRSYYDITKDLELNAAAYYVQHVAEGDIPSVIRLDAGVTWRPKPGFEISAGVQNLLDNKHPEFIPTTGGVQNTEVPRTVYFQLQWRL
jgi:iron complex outermembrane receptor protein